MLSRRSKAKTADPRPRDRRADDRRHVDRRRTPSVRQLPEVTTLVENGLRLTRFAGVALLLWQLLGLLGVPGASIQLFQGMLLFFLLGVDVLTNYRVRFGVGEAA